MKALFLFGALLVPSVMGEIALNFYSRLTNAAVVSNPPVTTTGAQGLFYISVNHDTNEAAYTLFHTVSSPKSCKLVGPAMPTVNGDPDDKESYVLSDDCKSPLRGSLSLNDYDVGYMLRGYEYITIASDAYPNGEVRGQVSIVDGASTTSAFTHVVELKKSSGSDTSARGLALIDTSMNNQLGYVIYHDLESPTQAALATESSTIQTISNGGSTSTTSTKISEGTSTITAAGFSALSLLQGKYGILVSSTTASIYGQMRILAPHTVTVGNDEGFGTIYLDPFTKVMKVMMIHTRTDATQVYIQGSRDNYVQVISATGQSPIQTTMKLGLLTNQTDFAKHEMSAVVNTNDGKISGTIAEQGWTPSDSSDSLSGGSIAGIVIGVLIGVALLAGGGFYAYRRSKGNAPKFHLPTMPHIDLPFKPPHLGKKGNTYKHTSNDDAPFSPAPSFKPPAPVVSAPKPVQPAPAPKPVNKAKAGGASSSPKEKPKAGTVAAMRNQFNK